MMESMDSQSSSSHAGIGDLSEMGTPHTAPGLGRTRSPQVLGSVVRGHTTSMFIQNVTAYYEVHQCCIVTCLCYTSFCDIITVSDMMCRLYIINSILCRLNFTINIIQSYSSSFCPLYIAILNVVVKVNLVTYYNTYIILIIFRRNS
jgi:hypothetical protein